MLGKVKVIVPGFGHMTSLHSHINMIRPTGYESTMPLFMRISMILPVLYRDGIGGKDLREWDWGWTKR